MDLILLHVEVYFHDQLQVQDCSCALLFSFQYGLHEHHSINKSIVPIDDDIEDDQRDDGGPDVEDGVHPEQVDTQIPKVVPDDISKILPISAPVANSTKLS